MSRLIAPLASAAVLAGIVWTSIAPTVHALASALA